MTLQVPDPFAMIQSGNILLTVMYLWDLIKI